MGIEMGADAPERIVVQPSHFVVGGAVLARDATERVVFVEGALPDETVAVQIRSSKKDFAKADVIEIIEPSPDRVTPACEVWHRGCGGCDWQHVRAEAQLEWKAEIVHEALSRMGRIHQPRMFLGGSVEPWGYRTTVRLAVDGAGRVGFRSRRSHDVVVTDHCAVAHPAINATLQAGTRHNGTEVTMRVGVASGEQTQAARGDDEQAHVHEVVAGHTLRISTGSFFQSGPQAAELLVGAVTRALTDLDLRVATLLDAYGGVGLFAVTVGADAARVIVVEGSAAACADARVNLAQRGAAAEVVQSRLEHWVPTPADVVIADPARSGLDKSGVAAVGATGAERIVLVSCDPAALARDTVLLRAAGYQHRYSEVLDLFPQTSHVEVVSRYDRE